MEPVSLIVAALIAGATKSSEGVAEESIKDAYAALKGLLKKWFKNNPAAEDALEKSETKPERYKPLLEDYVEETGAAQDTNVLEAAQHLLRLADPDGARNEQYNITGDIRADRGGVAAVKMGNISTGGYQAPAKGAPDPQ